MAPLDILGDFLASRFLISSSIRFFMYCQPLSTLSTHFNIAITPCMRKSPLCLATNERHFLYIHSSESNQCPRSATLFKLINAWLPNIFPPNAQTSGCSSLILIA